MVKSMTPTLEDVQETVLRNLTTIPFYGEMLRRPVMDHFRRCSSARDALRSRIIRRIYIDVEPWVQSAKRYEDVTPCILHPERAFPRFRRISSSLSARRLSTEFDQAMLDGFAAIDGAVYIIRDLGANGVEMLPQRGNISTPDAMAKAGDESFPMEAKRIRGERGFYSIEDEIDSRRALDPKRLSGAGVQVRMLTGTPRHVLENLSDQDVVVIGDSFESLAHRIGANHSLSEKLDLGAGRRIAIEVGEKLIPGGLMVTGSGGEVLPFDTGYLEEKITRRLREAASQLASIHEDGIN